VKLWEADHPYHCASGCFFQPDCHETHASWRDFHDAWGDSDNDYNLLFRWDWKQREDDDGKPTGEHRLCLFYFLQRKGYPISHEVAVTVEDEPAIHEWLRAKWQHMRSLWAPLAEAR
jgi:hypothetical protein